MQSFITSTTELPRTCTKNIAPKPPTAAHLTAAVMSVGLGRRLGGSSCSSVEPVSEAPDANAVSRQSTCREACKAHVLSLVQH